MTVVINNKAAGIPDSGASGGVKYQGTWNANTNTPDLGASTPDQGFYYVVSVAGSTSLGGITDWQIGDWAIYNGAAWQKVDNTDAVISVAGRQGAVVLTKSDVSLGNVDNTADSSKPVSTAQAAADALNLKIASNLSDLNSASSARTNLSLGNVDNTSDANKPVSTAQQTALNLKANLASPTFSGTISMGSNKIVSVSDPTTAQDAATKNYVDTVSSALNPIQAVSAASTANIVGLYVNGTAGLGATFTVTATGALSIDGVSPATNSRVLLKDQTSGFQNGVYVVTNTGSIGVSAILTRASDYNTSSNMNAGDLIPVISGTINSTTSYLQTATITTVGTDSLVFALWSANPASYLKVASNLSDLNNASTARSNLGLGSLSTQSGTFSGTSSGTNTGDQTVSKNYAQNAQFRFFQRQVPGTFTSFSDAAYGPDRWKVMSENASVQVAQVTSNVVNTLATNGSSTGINVRQINASASRFGIIQFLTADHIRELRGKTLALSFVAATDSTEVTSLRAGIIEWTGTADTITSDLVSSWGSTPTLVSNAAFSNTPADITISGTAASYTVSAAISESMNNLAIFIWAPNQEAQNDDFYLSKIQLTVGSTAASWEVISKSPASDLEECQRFYEKSYDLAVAPGTATNTGTERVIGARTVTVTAPDFTYITSFKVSKRATAPTIVVYSPNSGTSAKSFNFSVGGDPAATTGENSQRGFGINFPLVDQQLFGWQWTAESEI